MRRRRGGLFYLIVVTFLLAVAVLALCGDTAAQGFVSGNGTITTIFSVPVVPQNCHMDGVTDDLPCLQAAVNLAAAATVTAGITYGAPVAIPCGAYAISGPIVLPRSALLAYPFGVVQVAGASQNCVRIFEMSGFAAGKGAFEWAAVAGRTSAKKSRT